MARYSSLQAAGGGQGGGPAAHSTPDWSMTHFDVFLEVKSPRFVGKLTPKVNSRSEYATKILLVAWCKAIEGLIWVLVHSRVVPHNLTCVRTSVGRAEGCASVGTTSSVRLNLVSE